jgi:cytosine/adenosine deaminase-related metal-dependent hydrolase
VRVLSADWVVPVEGAPIENGAVAIDDAGLIAAVGSSSEIGEGDRYAGSVILPGFVNAHSHLEYAVYAGFGDGLDFPTWIALHIERKQRIELGDSARSSASAPGSRPSATAASSERRRPPAPTPASAV